MNSTGRMLMANANIVNLLRKLRCFNSVQHLCMK